MSLTGLVIIGRNEGERLRRCFLSVSPPLRHVVYVDSGSTDGSVALAKKNGIAVIELDRDLPFTAARARNTGFLYLMELNPDTKYVQFVDGDCELMEGWIETAELFLQLHPKHAVVCGRLCERYPEASIYNRLCDIEWNGSIGDVNTCGGIFMTRTKVFDELGGMDSSISAGEEPEMCLRLKRKNWLIARIDIGMAWHDANMISFGQWWRRAVRNGCGSIDVFDRTAGAVFAVQVKRTRCWTIGWIIFLLCTVGVGSMLGGNWQFWGPLCVAALYPLQILRIATKMNRRGLDCKGAIVYGSLIMICKWAELYGHCVYFFSLKKITKD